MHSFVGLWLLFIYGSMNSDYKVWLFIFIFFSQSVHIVYCLWIYKFHISVTFSLKMGLMVLFTYLKIILLQYFSVFSFNFKFSAVSKWTVNVNVLWLNFSNFIYMYVYIYIEKFNSWFFFNVFNLHIKFSLNRMLFTI